MPRYDLRTPCRNCPFRSDETRIRFSCRERAEEIEESAYRNGFPCHLSAELVEDDEEWESNGYVFGDATQHCAGYILMQLHESSGDAWPGMGNDEELLERLEQRMNLEAPVFHSIEEFLAANEETDVRDRRRCDP